MTTNLRAVEVSCGLILYLYVCSVQSNEILCQVLRAANTCELLAFLCFVSGFQPPQTEAQQTLYKRPNICIQYSAIGTLTARTLTEEEVLRRRNAEEMERMGTGIVALLNSELKQDNIIGAFFLVCLQHLTSIILHQTGYTCSITEDTLKPVSYSDQQQDDVPAPSERSSALLDCEAKLPLSQTEAYTSSLVLYITASICEELSSTLLQQVSLPDLLSSISALVSCHASFCEVINGKNHVKIVASEEHEILGGPITLGIVFGLLSAILSGIVAVSRVQCCTVTCTTCTCGLEFYMHLPLVVLRKDFQWLYLYSQRNFFIRHIGPSLNCKLVTTMQYIIIIIHITMYRSYTGTF